MPIKILMPALSPTMTEGKLSRWVKKEGEAIRSGDIIAEIETDKATMEYEATDDGVLGKILIPDGTENVSVNTLIGVMLEEGEDKSSIDSFVAGGNVATVPVVAEATTSTQAVVETSNSMQGSGIADVSYAGSPTKSITVREALREAMTEEMLKDETIYVLGEEVGHYQGAYKITQGMLDKFGPERIMDTPITEYGFTGMAIGSALSGLRPIVEYMNFSFSLQAIDDIINTAAKTHYMSGGDLTCPIVFRGLNGSGTKVAAQHSHDFSSLYANIPGLIVIAPYSAEDAKGLLKSAIRDNNAVIFLENEPLYGKTFEMPDVEDLIIPIGKAKIERSGTDVTIVSYSMGMQVSLDAAKELEAMGISAEVINLRTIRPLDIETIVNSVKKTNRLVSVEEGWEFGGIGSQLSAIAMDYAFDYLDAPVVRVTGKDVPVPYASNLEKLALLSVADVVSAAKKVCYK
ncbi:MAG: pyruvate dehydrogenase complex E1 component subunit beta [Alphaproteobacteria bacterium]|jgi:pyruvate dehydrogenase E1 component beta subunit|nr:pyruvate dehydrogenase complex E1 component subunit beta [Alphaproteobacteria bacterium]